MQGNLLTLFMFHILAQCLSYYIPEKNKQFFTDYFILSTHLKQTLPITNDITQQLISFSQNLCFSHMYSFLQSRLAIHGAG